MERYLSVSSKSAECYLHWPKYHLLWKYESCSQSCSSEILSTLPLLSMLLCLLFKPFDRTLNDAKQGKEGSASSGSPLHQMVDGNLEVTGFTGVAAPSLGNPVGLRHEKSSLWKYKRLSLCRCREDGAAASFFFFPELFYSEFQQTDRSRLIKQQNQVCLQLFPQLDP